MLDSNITRIKSLKIVTLVTCFCIYISSSAVIKPQHLTCNFSYHQNRSNIIKCETLFMTTTNQINTITTTTTTTYTTTEDDGDSHKDTTMTMIMMMMTTTAAAVMFSLKIIFPYITALISLQYNQMYITVTSRLNQSIIK